MDTKNGVLHVYVLIPIIFAPPCVLLIDKQ